jgi:hypothetical protein
MFAQILWMTVELQQRKAIGRTYETSFCCMTLKDCEHQKGSVFKRLINEISETW